jgi:putative transposase
VRRAYKFRLRPTARQHVALGQCLASHGEVYNAALRERRDAWRLRRTGVSYGEQSAQLNEIRAVRPDVAAWSFSSQHATLGRLNRAFASFFRRINAGQTPGYPRFKPAHRFDSVEWPEDGDGCRWQPDARRVYLQGIGQVKVSVHRRVEGRVKTIQVCHQGRRWMLVLSCDEVPTRPLEPTGAAVGVDLGIASFATASDGEHVPNSGYGRVAVKLGTVQQALARKQQPRPDPDRPGRFLPNRAAARTGLNRSIHDAGWAQFVSILRAKAEEAGRVVIDVDPRHTSDRCGTCGHTARDNRVSQAQFSCRRCGHTLNADEHAARNILRAGLARLAADPAV